MNSTFDSFKEQLDLKSQILDQDLPFGTQSLKESCFLSCIKNQEKHSRKEEALKLVEQVVRDEISPFVEKSGQFLPRCEAPFLPMQFTLWREVAVEKLQKRLLEEKIDVYDEAMAHFCELVDDQLLNKTYRDKLVEVYYEKLKDHKNYVPENLQKYLPLLAQAPEYNKLLRCLAEWLTLLELSNDLIHRIQFYGIAYFIDKQEALQKLNKQWGVKQDQTTIQNMYQQGKETTGRFLKTFSEKVVQWLTFFWIFSAIQYSALKYTFGIYAIHPGLFIGTLITAIFIKTSANAVEQAHMFSDISKLASYFSKVTTNLEAYYHAACGEVKQSFLNKDTVPLLKAVTELIEGVGKDQEGIMQKCFEEEEMVKLENIKEVEKSGEWIHVQMEND